MAIVAAVTDEFSPGDLDRALDAMAALGMTGVELRVVWDRNIIDLDDDEVDRIRAAAERRGMRVLSIASPVVYPNFIGLPCRLLKRPLPSSMA
jgi:sugar phosphate isomerase/epimerase